MEKDKYLHFKPTFENPLAYKDYYFDITNSDLCVWSLPDFSLVNCYPKISEAYYIKLRIISDNLLLIAENDTLKIFNIKEGTIISKIKEKDFIENIETQPSLGTVVTVVPGPDEKTKIVTKWELLQNNLNQVASVHVKYDQDITESAFSLFVFSSGKIYLHKVQSEIMYQIVPEEKQFKKNTVPITTSVVLELQNQQHFAVAEGGKISVNDPVKGQVFGSIECAEETYFTMVEPPAKQSLITASNKAVKLWVLESSTEPKIYQKSQKMSIDKLLIYKNQLIGISTRTKTIAIWNLQTQQLIKHQKISRQQIQKSFKVGDYYICLVIKIFDETEDSLTFHHRLELVQIENDKVIAFREVKNASYGIEVETIVPVDKQTIRFICSADKGDKQKSYLFSWRPFVKEQKKDMSKIEMSKAPITKLYPFDRLLLVTPPKEQSQVYQHFKVSEQTTGLGVYTHTLKQLVNLQIQGSFTQIQLNNSDKIYAIKPETICIFSLSSKTSSLEFLAQIQIQVTKIYFVDNRILCINNENDRALYDQKFELIMKHQGEEEDIISIFPIKKDELIVSSSENIQKWDLKKEDVEDYKMQFDIVGACLQEAGIILLTQSDRIQRFNLKNV